MRQLLACPFCRELYPETERTHCAECEDVRLVPLHLLPKSFEQVEREAAEWEATPPEDRVLPLHFLGRGRGALGALSLALGALFFAPWVGMELPELATFSGFDLARTRLPWLWGGAASWLTLLPLGLSRRSVSQMRGVRIIAATLSAMTLTEVLVLFALPPVRGATPAQFHWEWGFYLSAAVSGLAAVVGARFGGTLDRFDARFARRSKSGAKRETSEGQTLN